MHERDTDRTRAPGTTNTWSLAEHREGPVNQMVPDQETDGTKEPKNRSWMHAPAGAANADVRQEKRCRPNGICRRFTCDLGSGRAESDGLLGTNMGLGVGPTHHLGTSPFSPRITPRSFFFGQHRIDRCTWIPTPVTRIVIFQCARSRASGRSLPSCSSRSSRLSSSSHRCQTRRRWPKR